MRTEIQGTLDSTAADATVLAVILHAYTGSPASLADVGRAVRERVPGADLYIPKLPTDVWSRANPLHIALDLLAIVNGLWERKVERDGSKEDAGYRRIILIGHSLGALLARKIYVLACGENGDALFEPEARENPAVLSPSAAKWAGRVDRIVLLAAISRGWTFAHNLNLVSMAIVGAGTLISWLPMGERFCIMHIRRNAPFLVQLRIQWLSMVRNAPGKGNLGMAATVQLLGSIDDLVSPEDHVDMVTGANFIYLDVPLTDHNNIVEMGTATTLARKQIFQSALVEDIAALKSHGISPMDYIPRLVRPEVTDVVFVIHGIRDRGYWTHKLARRVVAEAKRSFTPDTRVFETETSNYGYFAMLPFLIPWARQEKVGWFMEQYTEAKALYPNASFSFVGHSNGTYLLAKALSLYPSCRFKRVVFAGSVVSSHYAWEPLLRTGQVESVLNYVATADWVVACFPKVLQKLDDFFGWWALRLKGLRDLAIARPLFSRWNPLVWLAYVLKQDLGGAGHDGFVVGALASTPGGFQEIRFVKGQHSAALAEENWDRIAEFVVHGKASPPPVTHFQDQAPLSYRLLGLAGPAIWLLILWGVVVVGKGILVGEWHVNPVRVNGIYAWDGFSGVRVLGFTAYCWACWKVLTRI